LLAKELPYNCAMTGGSMTAILQNGVAKSCSNNLSLKQIEKKSLKAYFSNSVHWTSGSVT